MKNEQIAELLNFAQTLKDNGFTVLIPKREKPSTWIIIFKNGNFGYIQCSNYFGGYDFSTVHKPCKEAGTGYGILRDAAPTVENANKTLLTYPDWAKHNEKQAIKKYKTIEEFLNNKNTNWCNYQVL